MDYQNRDQILQAMRDQITQNSRQGKATIATGMSAFDPAADKTVSQVFDRADNLMYENKALLKQGKSSVR